MKIAIEASTLMNYHHGGIAVATKNMIDAMLKSGMEITLYHKLSRFRRRKLIYRPANIRISWHYESLNFGGSHDISHTTDSVILNLKGSTRIITIHDLAIFKPQNNLPLFTGEAFVAKARENLNKMLETADGIITSSEVTRRDLIELFGYTEEKTKTVHLAANIFTEIQNTEKVMGELKLIPKTYFLFTGTISIRKNLINLVRAFSQSKSKEIYKLVLAGGSGMGHEHVRQEVEKLKLSDKVIFTGFVDDSFLPSLYQNAAAYLFPTYYEGFGMPILEAMHYKTPVLTGMYGSAPEVAAGHALIADPFSVDDISGKIDLITKFTDAQISAAKAHADNFTWEKTAKAIMEFYKKIRSLT